MAKTAKQTATDLRGRVWESDLLDYRGWRVNAMQEWKNRLRLVDNLYQGNWEDVFPDESVMRENPHVMNMVQVGLDDIARLTTEASPSTRCAPRKDTTTERDAARLREVIADTYWEANDGELLEPRIAMDLAGAGGSFLVVGIDDSDYPCIYRVDPRYAYPDIRNGKLVNLLTVETINARIAASLFPQFQIDADPTLLNRTVEILGYYEPGMCIQAIAYNRAMGNDPDTVEVVKTWAPRDDKGRPVMTAVCAQLDSFDGAFRGMFDQISGSLQTKNRIVKQLLDYTDEVVYAERFSKGLLNPEEPPGPMAHFRLDPNVPDAVVGRVPPAASAPQVFNMLEYLDREQRGGVGYPAARQGEVSQSIASATFVASTQGQLTTTVRNIQRLAARMKQQVNEVCYKLDEHYLNREKPLVRAIQKQQTYQPSKDIAGTYQNRVVYGAASGLDRISADNRVLQLLGAGVISHELASEQVDFIDDPRAQMERIEAESVKSAALQKLLQADDPLVLLQMVGLMADGKSFTEAAQVIAEQQAAQHAAAAQAQPGAPQVPGAPAQPGAGAPAFEEPGAVFQPSIPAEQVMVGRQPQPPARELQGGPA